jgi:hypothetical protein
VLEYYLLLRSVLHAKPHLRACRTRCGHCGIFFLTHPRNASRDDLRCPFGCRAAHRQQASAKRSAAYYRDPKGRQKKSDLNQRRPRQYCRPQPKPARSSSRPAAKGRRTRFNPLMVQYVAMVAGLLEGRRISCAQVRRMLARNLRQHTMCRRRKIDQTVAWLQEEPP